MLGCGGNNPCMLGAEPAYSDADLNASIKWSRLEQSAQLGMLWLNNAMQMGVPALFKSLNLVKNSLKTMTQAIEDGTMPEFFRPTFDAFMTTNQKAAQMLVGMQARGETGSSNTNVYMNTPRVLPIRKSTVVKALAEGLPNYLESKAHRLRMSWES